jgi:hypothetical protein
MRTARRSRTVRPRKLCARTNRLRRCLAPVLPARSSRIHASGQPLALHPTKRKRSADHEDDAGGRVPRKGKDSAARGPATRRGAGSSKWQSGHETLDVGVDPGSSIGPPRPASSLT